MKNWANFLLGEDLGRVVLGDSLRRVSEKHWPLTTDPNLEENLVQARDAL